MAKIDPKVFNTDPKHAEDREQLDEIIHSSVERLLEKRKKNQPKEDESVFDQLFAGLFGGKKDD